MPDFKNLYNICIRKENKERDMLTLNALNLLGEDEKAVIILRIIKGYSLKNAADTLKIPEETLKNIQFRALYKLKLKLHSNGDS